MARIFKEEERPVASFLPRIERVEELHAPLDSLSMNAKNVHAHPDAAYASVREADFAVELSRNVSVLHFEQTPLSKRFAKMLESI